MLNSFPYLGTPFQGITAAIIAMVGAVVIWYIRGWPDRRRATNETATIQAKIEEDLRHESALRFREFREEVHGLRNDLHIALDKVQTMAAESMRRGDKLKMLVFILRLTMDELHRLNPKNKVLIQAQRLLDRIEDEPHAKGDSTTVNAAQDTLDAAGVTLREVKAEEATASGVRARAARDAKS